MKFVSFEVRYETKEKKSYETEESVFDDKSSNLIDSCESASVFGFARIGQEAVDSHVVYSGMRGRY